MPTRGLWGVLRERQPGRAIVGTTSERTGKDLVDKVQLIIHNPPSVHLTVSAQEDQSGPAHLRDLSSSEPEGIG